MGRSDSVDENGNPSDTTAWMWAKDRYEIVVLAVVLLEILRTANGDGSVLG